MKVKLAINVDNFDSVLLDIGYMSNDRKFCKDCLKYSGITDPKKIGMFVVQLCKWKNWDKYQLFTNGTNVEILYTYICQKQKEAGLPMSNFRGKNGLFVWPDEMKIKKEELVTW